MDDEDSVEQNVGYTAVDLKIKRMGKWLFNPSSCNWQQAIIINALPTSLLIVYRIESINSQPHAHGHAASF